MSEPWVTVIGRGHSGTRAISRTLSASGVFMGEPLNVSGDLLPPQPMYDACRVFARYVRRTGELTWDFSAALSAEPPVEFRRLIEQYLASVLAHPHPRCGWKIPETTLVFPWILRMYPRMRYIFWVRDPRDCILGAHLTDDLSEFGIDAPATDDDRRRRAISWKYQSDLMAATPRPDHWIRVRLEDFVLDQDATLARLGEFLAIEPARIPVKPEAVGRWRTAEGNVDFDFLHPIMRELGYID